MIHREIRMYRRTLRDWAAARAYEKKKAEGKVGYLGGAPSLLQLCDADQTLAAQDEMTRGSAKAGGSSCKKRRRSEVDAKDEELSVENLDGAITACMDAIKELRTYPKSVDDKVRCHPFVGASKPASSASNFRRIFISHKLMFLLRVARAPSSPTIVESDYFRVSLF